MRHPDYDVLRGMLDDVGRTVHVLRRVSPTRRVVTLLGPQRRPDPRPGGRGRCDTDAPVATVTAGWQERESDDEELERLLAGRGVNLELHARWLEVLDRDREFARAESSTGQCSTSCSSSTSSSSITPFERCTPSAARR